MIFFNQTDVSINDTGILAENASVDIQSAIEPVYVVGKRRVIDQTPNGGIQNSIGISYLMEVDNEPNFGTVNQIKNFSSTTEELQPLTINVGGISGVFYLQSYQFSTQPNSPIQVSVSYVGFNQTSGHLKQKSNNITYNSSSGSGIGYGFATYITTESNYSDQESLGFNYSFQANYEPIYALGAEEPIAVKLLGASEEMALVRTGHYDPTFTGISPDGVLFDINNSTGIQIFSLSYFCTQDKDTYPPLTINVSGAKVNTTQVAHQVDNIASTVTTFRKFY